MTSTLRRPLTFAAHERATIGDSKVSFTDSDHLGWLKCDGRLLSTSDYALLFTVIGYNFGGSGSQFALPDARGRVPGAAGRSEANAANPTTYVKGDISGNQLHLLTIPEMPSHNHGVAGGGQIASNNRTSEYTHNHGGQTGNAGWAAASVSETDAGLGAAADNTGSHSHSIASDTHYHTMNPAGGDQYHNNMQPTIFMGNLFIFCGKYAEGTYPYTQGKGVF